jgi:hypothetical protein
MAEIPFELSLYAIEALSLNHSKRYVYKQQASEQEAAFFMTSNGQGFISMTRTKSYSTKRNHIFCFVKSVKRQFFDFFVQGSVYYFVLSLWQWVLIH